MGQAKTSTLKFLGHLNWRHDFLYEHELTQYHDEITPLLVPGDIVLTRLKGHLSNVVIKGRFTHAAVYIGQHQGKYRFIQSTGDRGVHTGTLRDLIIDKHEICLLENILLRSDQERGQFVGHLSALIGRSYDYDFDSDNDMYYCSELLTECVVKTIGANRFKQVMKANVHDRLQPNDYFEHMVVIRCMMLLRDFE